MVTVALEGEAFDIEGREDDEYWRAIQAGDADLGFLAAAFRAVQPPGALALDVGANIGVTSLLMRRLRPESRVLALEPSASTFAFLERNLAAEGGGHAEALRMALGSAEGPRGWVEDAANSSASHLSAATGEGANATAVTTLDRLVETRGLSPAFIKIDVEGFELDVLEGAERTLRELRPALFLELNSFTMIAYGDRSPKALIAFLLERFERVFRSDRGVLKELRSDHSVLDLLHAQMTSGCCVEDLLCIPHGRSFDEAALANALRRPTEPPGARDALIADLRLQLEALRTQHEAVTGSRTWRLAIGLRRALRRLGV